jgi:CheY-like chemotaxis protein/signal transduction histidine kinase
MLIKEGVAAAAVEALPRGDTRTINDLVVGILRDTEIRKINVINADNKVLLSLDAPDRAGCNCRTFTMPVYRKAIAAASDDFNVHADNADDVGTQVGTVSYTVDWDMIAAPLAHYFYAQMAVVFGVSILLGLLTAIVRVSITTPITALIHSLEQLEKGGLAMAEPDFIAQDETYKLHKALSVAVQTAREHQQAISKNNEQLLQQEHELKEQLQQLEEARMTAANASAERDLFIANITHQIRTPLQGIISCVETAQDHGIDSYMVLQNCSSEISTSAVFDDPSAIIFDGAYSTLKKHIHNIDTSLVHAALLSGQVATLIDDLLESVDVPDAQRIAVPTRVAVLTEINKFLATFKIGIKDRGLSLTHNFYSDCGSDPTLIVDWPRVCAILNALMSNAIKFTEQGGVHFQCHILPVGNNAAKIAFDLVDTGIGIAADSLASISSLLTTGEYSPARRYAGIGLGLPRAQRTARQLGAELSLLRSKPGAGSHFSLQITCDIAAGESAANTDKARRRQEQTHLSILYVEDDWLCQSVLKSYCERSAFDIALTIAGDGKQGFDAFKSGDYDLIVTDYFMPGMNGLELVEEIRQYERANQLRRIPIVVISADARTISRREFSAAGADDYLTKPYTKIVFNALIERLFFDRFDG